VNQEHKHEAAKATARQRRRVILVCVFLVLAVLAVFGQTARFEFVNYDDGKYVYENQVVQGGLTWRGLCWAFSYSEIGHWHPLTWLTHMADCQCYGLWAGGHHITNLVLHAISTVFLFLTMLRMTGALWRSAFAAAVFSVHPLRAESVAWIAERKDVLSGVFFMLTLWTYLNYVGRPSPLRYLAMAASFALGLLAKNMLVTVPLLLLLLDWWPLGRMRSSCHEQTGQASSGTPFLGLVREKIPLLLLSAASCLATICSSEKIEEAFRTPTLARIENAPVSYLVYMRQMFCPTSLASVYPFPHDGPPVGEVLGALALLTAVTLIVVANRVQRPFLLVGWLWYLGMLLPAIGIVQISYYAHADRYTYLPSIGLAIAGIWLIGDWTKGWRHRHLILGSAGFVVVSVLAFLGYVQTTHWRDSETLWTQALKCNPDNRFAHYNLGIILLSKDKTDEAIAHFRRAVEIYPGATEAWNNLGQALFKKGEKKEAIAQFRRALEVDSNHDLARCNLATALAEVGQLDEAADQYRQVLQREPDLVMAHNALAVTLDRLGHTEEAIAEYRRVLKSEPADIEVLNHLGLALAKAGKLDEASETYREAIRIEPRYADAYFNLGAALSQKGEIRQAIDCWQQCLAIQPYQPIVQNKLAWLLATAQDVSLRDGAKAVALAESANDLTSGGDPVILHTLASAYEESKRFPDALATARRAHELALALTNAALAATLEKDIQRYESMNQKSDKSR
jgi:protein O-mannosyl-transferase